MSTDAKQDVNAPASTLFSRRLGDMLVEYVSDGQRGPIGLSLVPASLSALRVEHRPHLRGRPEVDLSPNRERLPSPWQVEPLVQLKWRDDPYPGGFSNGHTLRNSFSTQTLAFKNQQVQDSEECVEIITTLEAPTRGEVIHHLRWFKGAEYLETWTEVTNSSARPQSLQLLSSFTLGSITPFDPGEAPGRLLLHRFRSQWSAEGRKDTLPIESLGLERSWAGYGTAVERFGQVGSMPVRRFFPFVALEDADAAAVWAASLSWGGSWQMEVSRKDDDITLSGGLADADFGHWTKTLGPGERFSSPKAFLTTVAGDLTDACQRLLRAQETGPLPLPKEEEDGAIAFNDWCQNWGKPSLDKIRATLEVLKGTPIRYFVIDAGWYKSNGLGAGTTHGDWEPDTEAFPTGLDGAANLIKEAGMLPGIWFEMETCGNNSRLFQREDLLLHRDGVPLTVDNRRFLDLTNPKALSHLRKRVLGTLTGNGFKYLKVDYNNTTGTGADGSDSLGETLRQQIDAAYAWFDEIREAGIIVENCSSGGHRLEHGFITRSHQFSFSDAHEALEIPLIAASIQQLCPAWKSQIWAVLHPENDTDRLRYSLAATFLGRMCLSGPIEKLSTSQWQQVREAMDFYPCCWPIIKNGFSRSFGPEQPSWRSLHGWQAVRRVHREGSSCLIVVHTFEQSGKDPIRVPLPAEAGWRLTGSYPGHAESRLSGTALALKPLPDFSAAVFVLQADTQR